MTPADANLVGALLTYGPMGIMLVWLMWRVEERFEKMADRLETLAHRINGMTRAMLADILSRDSSGAAARKIAEEMLTKMDEPSDPRQRR